MQRCVVAALNPWSTWRPNSLHAKVAGHDITVLPPLMVGTGGTEKGHCYQNDLPHLSTPRFYKYTAKGAMDKVTEKDIVVNTNTIATKTNLRSNTMLNMITFSLPDV